MDDREKVVSELQSALEWCQPEDNPNGSIAVKIWAVRGAVELLKEQEPLAVDEGKLNKCVCGNEINRYWHPEYCGFCGKKLEWY